MLKIEGKSLGVRMNYLLQTYRVTYQLQRFILVYFYVECIYLILLMMITQNFIYYHNLISFMTSFMFILQNCLLYRNFIIINQLNFIIQFYYPFFSLLYLQTLQKLIKFISTQMKVRINKINKQRNSKQHFYILDHIKQKQKKMQNKNRSLNQNPQDDFSILNKPALKLLSPYYNRINLSIQSSSFYIQSGMMPPCRYGSLLNKSISDQIKQSSLILPNIKRTVSNKPYQSPNHKPYQSLNDKQFKTIDVRAYQLNKYKKELLNKSLDKTSNHLVKRNSFHVGSSRTRQRDSAKTQYLKNIVDKYFPSLQQEPTHPTLQMQTKKNKLQYQHNQQNQIQNDLLHQKPLQSSFSFSMSKSYLLERIDEDEQQNIFDTEVDLFKNSPNSFQLFQPEHSLINNSRQSLIDLAKSQQMIKDLSNQQQQIRKLVYKNHSFCIYRVQHVNVQKNLQKQKVRKQKKRYEFQKQFLNQAALELKYRQLQTQQIRKRSSLQNQQAYLWQQVQFQPNCLILNLTNLTPPSSIQTTIPLTLSKLLLKIIPSIQTQGTCTIRTNINQKTFLTQKKLLQKGHQGLRKLIKTIAQQLFSVEKQLINNKVCLSNVLLIDQNRYAINQWAYSYFRQSYPIQGQTFQKRKQPLLQNYHQQWFCAPQYLAPQILQNLLFAQNKQLKYKFKVNKNTVKQVNVIQTDLFQYGNVSDVWSLGLLALEIITLIPIWIADKSIVQNAKNHSIKPRKGLLHTENRDLLKMLTKQSYLKHNLIKIIKLQSQSYQIQSWLLQLLSQMLEFQPKNRIKLDEIIIRLNGQNNSISQS